MSKLEAEYRSRLQDEGVDNLDPESALNHLARLIDLAFDFKDVDGTKRALQIGEGIGKRSLTSAQTAILDYYISNTWAKDPDFPIRLWVVWHGGGSLIAARSLPSKRMNSADRVPADVPIASFVLSGTQFIDGHWKTKSLADCERKP